MKEGKIKVVVNKIQFLWKLYRGLVEVIDKLGSWTGILSS